MDDCRSALHPIAAAHLPLVLGCPACLTGAAKLAARHLGGALRTLLPLAQGAGRAVLAGAASEAAAAGPLLAAEDAALAEARAQAAFPLFAKFQPSLEADGGVSIIGLRALCMRLAMDISEVDLDRVFCEADRDGDTLLSAAEFSAAVGGLPFFASLAAAMTAALGWRAGRDYDYSRSTRENYAGEEPGPAAPPEGDEALAARATLAAPAGYTAARARWQESLVRLLAPRGPPQAAPWLVVTLAPPGALPQAALEWVARQGFLPLRGLLRVDAQRFLHCLPELPLYLRRHGPGGREFLREEAELLEALALEVGLSRRQHVWLQGLPRDAGRLAAALPALRRRHPAYSVAVLDVRAGAEVLGRRRRAVLREMGRDVPEGGGEPPEDELRALAASAELLAHVEHDGDQPVLRSVQRTDASGSWGGLARCLAPEAAGGAGAAPALPPGPLRLERRMLPNGGGLSPLAGGGPSALSVDLGLLGPCLGCSKSYESLAPLLGAGAGALELALSAAQKGMPGRAAEPFRVKKAVRVAWLHPYGEAGADFAEGLRQRSFDPSSLLVFLLLRGGFVHFDEKGVALCIDVATDKRSEMVLQFAQPEGLPAGVVTALQRRWQPVVDEGLRRSGARHECWLPPGESIAGRTFPEGGAFAYRLSDEAAAMAGHCGVFCRVLC